MPVHCSCPQVEFGNNTTHSFSFFIFQWAFAAACATIMAGGGMHLPCCCAVALCTAAAQGNMPRLLSLRLWYHDSRYVRLASCLMPRCITSAPACSDQNGPLVELWWSRPAGCCKWLWCRCCLHVPLHLLAPVRAYV
jgi:hypothetical protein